MLSENYYYLRDIFFIFLQIYRSFSFICTCNTELEKKSESEKKKHIKKLESVVYYIIKRHQAEEGTQKKK